MKLEDQIAHLKDGRLTARRPDLIHDERVEQLIAAGQRTEAIRHCKEMCRMASGMGEPQRAQQYVALIDWLHTEQSEFDPQTGI
jgi:hypothetical protein